MKIKLAFAFLAIIHTGVLNSQTLYVPNGAGGITSSGNGNIGIGTSLPSGKLSIIDGALHINTTGNGSTSIDDLSTAIVLGPKVSRNGNVGTYYAGLGFNHLLNYNFTTTYNSSNHAWIGLRLVTTPGSEQSDLIFATKEGIEVSSKPIERMCLKYNGNLGIGTDNATHPLTVKPRTDIDAISWQRSADGLEVGRLGVTGGSGTGRYGWIGLWDKSAVLSVQIDAGGGNSFINSGNVGIGTTNPKNLLDVNGTIHAREVKVDLTGWSDFVFHPSYGLKPLIDVERYIKINGHLENIPSAAEVEQNGVNVGEMQKKLLQKVEELTLYTIEQNKKLEKQTAELEELKAVVKKQNEKIEMLESNKK